MKLKFGLFFIIDCTFIAGCLVVPRSGMEAMASVFFLIPLAIVHLLAGIAICIVEMRQKRWFFSIFFVTVSCFMVLMFQMYSTLKPTYRPLYQVLVSRARLLGHQLVSLKNLRLLEGRKWLQKQRDFDHAKLCETLFYPVEAKALLQALQVKPSFAPCVLPNGRKDHPLMVILAENYAAWSRADKEDQQQQLVEIRKAVDLLVANGADPNTQDMLGNTPLHWALRYRDEPLVSELLAHGACVYLKNNEDQSVLQTASSYGFGRITREAAENPQMTLNCPQIFTHDKQHDTAKGQKDRKLSWTKGLFRGVTSKSIGEVAKTISQGADVHGRDDQGRSPLHLATTCKKEIPAIIELLVTAGADVNSLDNKGNSPLITAAGNHCPKVINILLGKGANPALANTHGETAMHWLARWQADRLGAVIDSLLAAGATIDPRDTLDRTPLMMTAYSPLHGDDSIQIFLSRGADPNAVDRKGNSLLHTLAADSAKRERVMAVTHLLAANIDIEKRNSSAHSPLMLAVKTDKISIAAMLLEAGASPDTRSSKGTPLLHKLVSCKREKLSLLKIFINSGADINAADTSGQTALHRALRNHLFVNCLEPLEFLLQARAKVNIHDNSGTAPLHNLASWEQKDSAAALALITKHGGDIDIKDSQGLTTLLRAARFGGRAEVLRTLLAAGADPGAIDNRGNTLLHCVAMNIKGSAGEHQQRLRLALRETPKTDVLNSSGKTALELALEYGNTIVSQGLNETGALQ